MGYLIEKNEYLASNKESGYQSQCTTNRTPQGVLVSSYGGSESY